MRMKLRNLAGYAPLWVKRVVSDEKREERGRVIIYFPDSGRLVVYSWV